MKKTGELIKNARESKGLSIHEISLNLKINSKVLKAIEEGEVQNLPAKTFLRGFVKSYATYLKMDVDTVLKNFSEEMGTTKPELLGSSVPSEVNSIATEEAKASATVAPTPTIQSEASPRAAEPRQLNVSSKKGIGPMVYSVVAVVLVVLILVAKQVVEKYQKEAVVDSQTVSAVTEGSAVVPLATPIATTETTVPVTIPTTTTTVVISMATKNINPQPTSPVSSTNSGEIIIQAKKDFLLEIKNSQGDSQKIDMKAKDVHTLKTSTGLEIILSDGASAEVFVNGKTAGKLGEANKPIRLTY